MTATVQQAAGPRFVCKVGNIIDRFTGKAHQRPSAAAMTALLNSVAANAGSVADEVMASRLVEKSAANDRLVEKNRDLAKEIHRLNWRQGELERENADLKARLARYQPKPEAVARMLKDNPFGSGS